MSTDFLFRRVDAAPMAIYRILMGLLMAAEGFGAILTGWVRENYVDVPFTFNFIGFEFLQIFVGPQMYAVYVGLGIAGIGIALGYRYRLMAIIYTILWGVAYFGQKSSYNNHYYLLLVTSALYCFMPLHRYLSLDVKQGRVEGSETVAYWSKWLLKVLLLVVYVYAALAKVYPDWLSGKTVGVFFSGKLDYPIIGPLLAKEWFVFVVAYGGIFFDLLVIPGLWYKPTRKMAFGFSIFFHIFNAVVFKIGIFPFMMLIATVLYFESDTIRKIFLRGRPFSGESGFAFPSPALRKFIPAALGLFLIVQILLPLRPQIYPGSSHWTEEAHRLSWHMMLRSKWGKIEYVAIDSTTGLHEMIKPEDQIPTKLARSTATRPDMAWQYAQILAAKYRANGHPEVRIYVKNEVSLNGRPLETLIDPTVDLAAVEWSHIHPHSWILPHPDL